MNFGKSLCILCEKPLAEATLVAHPCDCPTHHFHCECLVKHARQSRQCPIDQIDFETVICEGGVPITIAKADRPPRNKVTAERPTGNSAKVEDNLVKTRPPEERDTSNQDVPASVDSDVRDNRSEEGAINRENYALPTGSKITSERDSPCPDSVTKPAPEAYICVICGKTIDMTDMASPDSCNHWFHTSCLDSFTDKCNICPFEGCYREIGSFTSSSGNRYGLHAAEGRDYRLRMTAPENFICKICDRADLHRHRAVAKPCGHLLHRSCLIEYVRENKKCPVCKIDVRTVECDPIGHLFFP